MNKYRRKPTVVEAEQYLGTKPFPEGVYEMAKHDVAPVRYVDTLSGTVTVQIGDWIITGDKGTHYPCNEEVFAKTYEEVPPTREEPKGKPQ